MHHVKSKITSKMSHDPERLLQFAREGKRPAKTVTFAEPEPDAAECHEEPPSNVPRVFLAMLLGFFFAIIISQWCAPKSEMSSIAVVGAVGAALAGVLAAR